MKDFVRVGIFFIGKLCYFDVWWVSGFDRFQCNFFVRWVSGDTLRGGFRGSECLRDANLSKVCTNGFVEILWRGLEEKKINMRQSKSWHHAERRQSLGQRMLLFNVCCGHTQRIFFEILLSQAEIKLCLQCPDWFESKRTSIWIQITSISQNHRLFLRKYLVRMIEIFGSKYSINNFPLCVKVFYFLPV